MLCAHSCAIRSAPEPSSATPFHRPQSRVSSPVKTRPESSRSFARVIPMSRGSVQLIPYSAGKPNFGAAVVHFADAETKRRSQNSGSARPIPAHAPLMAAMTGTRRPKCHARSWSNSEGRFVPGFATVALSPGSYPPRSACPANASESPPTQNVFPSPVTTIARMFMSSLRADIAFLYSACMRPVHALARCGRLRETVATCP